MKKQNKDINQEKDIPQNKYNDFALGKKCFVCNEIFEKEKIEKSKNSNQFGLADIPVKMNNIPGFLHRSCRKRVNDQLINDSFDHHKI